MSTEKQAQQKVRSVDSNRNIFRCAWDSCSHTSGKVPDNESQKAGMFLNGNAPFNQTDQDESSLGSHSASAALASEATSGDNVDKLLAADMNSLSLQERDVVYDEIHGVANPVQETPSFVQTKLDELQQEIKKIKHEPAYDRATAMKPDYLLDPAFCIQFLRAKRFNTKAAAAQLVAHLEIKQELFGTHKLCSDISLSDLGEDDRDLLRSGMYPYIATRDRAGRAICFLINRLVKFKFFENWARMLFFFYMSHLRDEEVQRRGLVVIMWMHGSSASLTQNDFLLWTRSTSIAEAMPIRISGGMHYCTAGTMLHPGLELALAFTGRHLRIRFRVRVGSALECLYNLASYGIPLYALPIDADGEVVLDEHFNWYHRLLITDGTSQDKTGLHGDTITPGLADILMGGKSKEFMYNPGNLALRKIVEEMLPTYDSLPSRMDKTFIAVEIVQKIKADGGRFLNREDDFTWKEVNNEVARGKVAHAFRNQRRLAKKKIVVFSNT